MDLGTAPLRNPGRVCVRPIFFQFIGYFLLVVGLFHIDNEFAGGVVNFF